MKLKVCGMKYRDNILKVAALKPDYMGFIFYEKSLRFMCEDIPVLPNDIKKVGVFVDASIEKIKEMREKFNLNAVQLHGHESPEFCQKLRNEHIEIIKVFSVENEFDFSKLKVSEPHVSYFLFDTKGPNPGGNGYSFDWTILQNYNSNTPYFLSGGIGINDVDNVLSFFQKQASQYCVALDVNSRFESEPGVKKIEELRKFNFA